MSKAMPVPEKTRLVGVAVKSVERDALATRGSWPPGSRTKPSRD